MQKFCRSGCEFEASASVADFTRLTGEPAWAAAVNDGHSITLQPLELLAQKGILSQTLRHELTHLVVHRLKAKNTSAWFWEGVVLDLTGERINAPPSSYKNDLELDAAVEHPHSETEMKGAYAEALERVRLFVKRNGEAALWRAIERPAGFNVQVR